MRKLMFALTVLAAACGGEELLPELMASGPTDNSDAKSAAVPTADDSLEPNWAELGAMMPKIIVAEPTADDIRNAPDEPCGGICPADSICDEAINACVATHGAMAEFFAPGACTNPELEISLVRSATSTYASGGVYDIELMDMSFSPRPTAIVQRIIMLTTDSNIYSNGLRLRDRYYGDMAQAWDGGRLQDFRLTLQSLFSERRWLRVSATNLYSPRTSRQELVLYAVHAVNPKSGLPARVCFRRALWTAFQVMAPEPCSQNHPRLGYPLAWIQKVAPGTREYRRFATGTSSAAIMDVEITACEDLDLHGLPVKARALGCDITIAPAPMQSDYGLFSQNGPMFSGLRIRTGTVTFATDALDPTPNNASNPGSADCENHMAFRGISAIRMIRGETRRFALSANIGERAMPPRDFYETQFKIDFDGQRLTATRMSNGQFVWVQNLTGYQNVQVLD